MAIDRQQLAKLRQQPSFYKGRFRNRDRTPSHGLKEFIRWQRETGGKFPPAQRFPLLRPDPGELAAVAEQPRVTWLGHASFLIQYRDINLLTDPVLSERASPLPFAGPKRATPAPLSVNELPDIDQVLISHNHYDHLDAITVAALKRRFGDSIRWCVPIGVGRWFRRRNIHNLIELDWWQSASAGNHEVFCVPAQHFSGRGATDRNRSLWCGWVCEFDDFRLYFAGDTGYGSCFAEIGQVFGGIDLALIPIGAYAPRWFMAPVHVDPEGAVNIFRDIGARQAIAMHWGTFVLTDEPLDEPPRELQKALAAQAIDQNKFKVLQHGETITVPLGESAAQG